MSDEHVSYKAYFPGLTCKQPAPNLGPLWARQQNAFRVVFFWQAESSRILRAYWELFDQFLSLHVFIPRPGYGEVPKEIEIDFELKKVLLPPLGNFADISYLEENFKPHLLRDVCTLCSGALVSDSLLHMLL